MVTLPFRLGFFEWHLDKVANGDSLTNADISYLTDLADECPDTSGAVVLMAKARLQKVDSLSFKEWTQYCELLPDPMASSRMSGTSTSDSNDIEVEANPTQGIIIYPNPTTGSIWVWLSEKPEENWLCTLHDLTGRVQMSLTLSDQNQQVWIGQLSSGMYYLTIEDSTGELAYSEKLMIHK